MSKNYLFKNFTRISEIKRNKDFNYDCCYVIKLDPIKRIHPEIDFHINLEENGVIYVGKGKKGVGRDHRFATHKINSGTNNSSLRRNLCAVLNKKMSFKPKKEKKEKINKDDEIKLTSFIKDECKVKFFKPRKDETIEKLETKLVREFQPTLNRDKKQKINNDKKDKEFAKIRGITINSSMPRDKLWNIYYDDINKLYSNFWGSVNK